MKTSRPCQCPFDAVSAVEILGFQKSQVHLVCFLLQGLESALSLRSLVPWEMGLRDHRMIMPLLGPIPLAFLFWLFILFATFMSSVPLPKDFSYGHSSVPWPDICFSIPKCEHFSLFTLLVFLLEIPLVAAYFLLLA